MLRGRLFRKYALVLSALLSVALLASGLTGAYFSYRDTRALVEELQREKARFAATRIEQFLQTAELQLRSALPLDPDDTPQTDDAEYLELLKLMRIAPAIAKVAWINNVGRERVQVSRVTRDVLGSNLNRAGEPAFQVASSKGTWYGPVFFSRGSEPYFSASVADRQRFSGALIADINIKFVQDVVSAIRSGKDGHAYLTDAKGRLISHPELSMVLKLTDLSTQPQVVAALSNSVRGEAAAQTLIGKNQNGIWVLTANAPIEVTGWHVFIEQPLNDAFAPLLGSVSRSALVLLLGLALAVVASRILAKQMVAPIRTLEAGVARLAAGRLDEPVLVQTRDELEDLSHEFNHMAQQLKESYADLEQKIETRTHQLSEANNAKSRFLAAASHDLRQPVHALGLFVAQLEDARDPHARKRIVEKIATSSMAVSELLEALLDISRLDADNLVPQFTRFALQPLLERMEQSFALTAEAKGLRLRLRPSTKWVSSDSVLLERILSNLISNAVRYTREGGVLISVRQRRQFVGTVTIEVWDTGVGIAPAEQQHIFEEFYRLPGDANDSIKGLGLGLAIVERLGRLLGAPVTLDSKEGCGSKFSVRVQAAEPGVATALPWLPAAQSIRLEGLRVLLIDDAAEAREAATGLLVQWGCHVTSVGSGQEAIVLCGAGGPPPALIVCDYHLSQTELGTDVIRQIRALLGASIPAVIVSGDVTPTLQEQARAGGLHLLYKPLKATRLRALLHHVFSNPGTASTVPETGI